MNQSRYVKRGVTGQGAAVFFQQFEAFTGQLQSFVQFRRVGGARRQGRRLTGGEGTFNMCTFWLVEALTRAGRLEEARFIFEKMLTYANHLGLYAEETGPSGEALGNFPQAFTHMGLISAAFNLDRRLEGRA